MTTGRAIQVTRGTTSPMTTKQAIYLLRTIWKDAPETEIIKAAIVCFQYNLNPLMRQVFLIRFDKYNGRGENRQKVGEDWTMVLGIKATRAIAQKNHSWSYVDGPRMMSDEEQVTIYGERDANLYRAICVIQDKWGNKYPGYGAWAKANSPYGSDKGNTAYNMAFIRAERNALDKLAPGELPSETDTLDENLAIGDFKSAIEAGKGEFLDKAKEDIADLWDGGKSANPLPNTPESATPPPNGATGGNTQPAPEKPVEIDLVWLKESLQRLQWKSVLIWTQQNMGIEETKISLAVAAMTNEQRRQFVKEVETRLENMRR